MKAKDTPTSRKKTPAEAQRERRRRRDLKPEAVAARTAKTVAKRVARETEKKVKSAILQDTPPWLIGLKETHMPMTPAVLRRLGLWLSTFSEAASFLGISVDTLSRRMQANPILRRAWDEGHEQGRSTLRRRQLEIAYSDAPQAAMLLIHLGKTILNQRDRVEHSGAGGGPIRFNAIRRVIVDPALPEGERELDVTREPPAEPMTKH